MDSLADILSQTQGGELRQDAPTPLYFRLYSLLKQAILNGTVANGTQMPTEQQLAESFNVSRITARRAMDELAAESLVKRHRGKGTHVIYEYVPRPVQAPLIGMLQEIESMARHSEVMVMTCRRASPPAPIAQILGLEPDSKALHLIRVRSRDGQPFGHYASWTTGIENALSKSDFRNTPRLEIFRRHGLQITHVTQTISAEAASTELAERLKTSVGSPLISLLRHSYTTAQGKTSLDKEEHTVDYLQVYYHPERFQYQMDLKIDEN
ncbi:MAG: GntR family transcriptional regulator [Gammaproteobacteria bacterium]|nr:GntR family transcriptional regulator [Gammaproteobacteria bacterium]